MSYLFSLNHFFLPRMGYDKFPAKLKPVIHGTWMFTLNWEQAAGRSSFSWQSWRQQRIQVPGESWTQSWWLYGSQSRRSQSPHKTWAFSTRKAVSNMKNQTQENYQTLYTSWIKGPPSLTSSDTNPCAKSNEKETFIFPCLALSATWTPWRQQWAHWASPNPPPKATWVTLSRYNQWHGDHAELTTPSVFQERTHHLELVYVPHGFIGIGQLLLSWGLLKFRLLRSFSVSPSLL